MDKLRKIIREEIRSLLTEDHLDRGDIVRYEPKDFYETGGPAVILNDRTVASGADYVIGQLSAIEKYDEMRKYSQEVTDGEVEALGVKATPEEFQQLQKGTVPQRIKNVIR